MPRTKRQKQREKIEQAINNLSRGQERLAELGAEFVQAKHPFAETLAQLVGGIEILKEGITEAAKIL